MKYFYFAIAIICCTSCAITKKATFAPAFASNPVVAHRGAWKKNNLPENSIAALRQAILLNCTGSEFDVRMTADDSLIINHDPHYNKLPIEQSTYRQLTAFRLSNGEPLPTLRAYILEGMKNNTTTRLVCEIKPSETSKERGRAIATRVVQLVKELNAKKMVSYISFDEGILQAIRSIDPAANTQYLQGNSSPAKLSADGVNGADYHFSVFKNQHGWIDSAKKLNLTLNAWTVNDPADMDWLLSNAFDYITTNEPELLFERIAKSPVSAGWKLSWSDEFNNKGLPDSSKWNYETGGNGWGNNELQYYTAHDTNNARVNNGQLHIVAIKQPISNRQYSSARLVTKNKAEFTYGLVEVRAKLPAGRGTWPAIWMLGKNINTVGWPECGEIDIMEHVGYEKDSIFGTIHTSAYNHVKGTQKTKAIYNADPYTNFHDYSIEWTPEKIDFKMDGKVYNHIVNEKLSTKEWPFDQPFYMILNLAIGGNWGGKMGVDDTIFPATMLVDYVRVFQKNTP